MLPIHMNKELYTRIAPYARIPSVLPQVLMNKTAVQICTEPQLPPHLCGMPQNKIRNEYLSFILQSIPGAMNHVCAGASFTYHFPSKHMYIFMHGLASANYDRFSYAIQSGAAKDSAFLIPSIMTQFRLEQLSKVLNLWHDKVYWNERKLGIRFDHHDNPDPAGIDYTTLSKDLNAANTNLAYLDWSCKTIARQLDFMDDIAHRFRSQAVKNGTSEDAAADTEHLLLETQAHLRSWNTGLADRAEYLSKRGQALVQTVYSGIAQRDSAISLRLAATSTELAQTSHEVAISTSRDSSVMRVIAAITIFFLPATFTATFFSTTFFSFNERLEGRVYSDWLWLYFVVTLVLTAVVVVGTWALWKGKEKEISTKLKKPMVEEARVPPQQLPPQSYVIEDLNKRERDYIQHEIGTLPTHY
ncbi:hypothetical protein FB567DRAFT_124711 [Paraphoma chrysanthemicola]|uniref:Uncharacterized protein n=1 Tax=Paraphoma chrysanthemicola TaxID=798071 RepID=A0A8K0VV18_9PLEO|nr:hypothetical protein FB567DRAFT_124711 [Paraphoma chrysanthemicola]